MASFEVIVELKKEVLDAEGRAIRESLVRLGHDTLKNVTVGKRFVLQVTDADDKQAQKKAEAIAKEFLANPVSETFQLRKLNGNDQAQLSR